MHQIIDRLDRVRDERQGLENLGVMIDVTTSEVVQLHLPKPMPSRRELVRLPERDVPFHEHHTGLFRELTEAELEFCHHENPQACTHASKRIRDGVIPVNRSKKDPRSRIFRRLMCGCVFSVHTQTKLIDFPFAERGDDVRIPPIDRVNFFWPQKWQEVFERLSQTIQIMI